jgi:hypothetical protein
MKKQLFAVLIFALLISGRQLVPGQVIYVGPAGNDQNPGTRLRPLATLESARDRARELRSVNIGDKLIQIVLLEGEYYINQPLKLPLQ